MIRNAVGNLEEHADYFKYFTKWREKVDSWKNATPPIPVTWDMFKIRFNQTRTQIDNNPTGKHAMKINEVEAELIFISCFPVGLLSICVRALLK